MEFRDHPNETIVRCPKCKRTVAEKARNRNIGARPDFEDYCKGPVDWVVLISFNVLFILLVLCIILLPIYFIFK